MGINRDKPDLWKDDVAQSVDLYNTWFMEFALRPLEKQGYIQRIRLRLL